MRAETAIPDISFRGVSKRYGDVAAVDRVDLDLPKGAFVSLLGPSGCGKTTCLRMMAGFEQPSEGEVYHPRRQCDRRSGLSAAGQHGVPALRAVPASRRRRQCLLRPAPALARSRRASEIDKAVDEALAMVRLAGYGERRTWELSGGQQQRVALARALINRPAVLLLDEPLAALDRKLRREMQIELQNLQRDVGITFLLVTHDQEEALSMSRHVCIMRTAASSRSGTPRELYDEPVNALCRGFRRQVEFLCRHAPASDRQRLIESTLGNGMPAPAARRQSARAPKPGERHRVAERAAGADRLAAATGDLPDELACSRSRRGFSTASFSASTPNISSRMTGSANSWC